MIGWLVCGFVGWLLLPWFALPDSFKWSTDLAKAWTSQDTAPAVLQVTLFGRWWLWGPLLGLAGVAASLPMRDRRAHALLLTYSAAAGAALMLVAGFTIGMQGWSINVLKGTLPPLASGQYGIGWGGLLTLVSLLMLVGIGLGRLGYFRGDQFTACAVIGCAALLLLFIGFPVFKALVSAFQDDAGKWSAAAAAER